MTILEFVILFMLLTLVSSFFIIGFYNISRYYIEVQPDGKEIVKGYALKWWSYCFEYVKRWDKKYYSGEALRFKLSSIVNMFPEIAMRIALGSENSLCTKITEKLSTSEVNKLEKTLSCKFNINEDQFNGMVFIFPYIEEPIYLFPSIIRKPFSQCVVCMSSVFGSGIWFFVNYLYNPFNWANHYYLALFGFWVIFIVVLSKLNDILQTKFM